MYATIDDKETILFSKNIVYMQRVDTHLHEIHLKYDGHCKTVILSYTDKGVRDSEYVRISEWMET